MKKFSIGILIIVLLGIIYYLVSPLWIDKMVSENIPVTSNSQGTFTESKVDVIKQGSFSGFDAVHNGSGTTKLLDIDGKLYIRFEEDFQVNNGPDLYVGLGQNGEYIKGSELAKLKGNIGSQNYELSSDIKIDNINEVWIWCKAFSVPFAKAVLINND